ncbi:MAG TPA: hypothetical protein VNT81_11930 [Vicinamibacterales bacterium]|nr:hypothetical protein [Vicinamibacterales bacterium]
MALRLGLPTATSRTRAGEHLSTKDRSNRGSLIGDEDDGPLGVVADVDGEQASGSDNIHASTKY